MLPFALDESPGAGSGGGLLAGAVRLLLAAGRLPHSRHIPRSSGGRLYTARQLLTVPVSPIKYLGDMPSASRACHAWLWVVCLCVPDCHPHLMPVATPAG
jgi:hypothetical protein